MHRIDGPGHASNLFTEGNPAGGIPATTVTDDWLNDSQEELCNLVEAAGIALVKADQDQVRQAIAWLSGQQNLFGKNNLINSSFDWWQRYGSPRAGISTDGYQGPDRWYIRPGSGGVCTLSKEAVAFGGSDQPLGGSSRFLRWVQTTGGTGPELAQRCELLDAADGQTYVFSFKARVSAGTLVCTPRVRQFWGSTGSAETVTDYPTITLTTAWQQFDVVLAVPSGSGKTATGAGQFTAFGLVFPDATTFTAEFGWPQVTLGPYPSPYYRPNDAVEFVRINRYFFKSYGTSVNPGDVTDAGVRTGLHNGVQRDIRTLGFPLLVPMRSTPTVRWYSPRTGTVDRVEDPVASTDYVVSATRWPTRTMSGVPQLSTNPGAVSMAAHVTMEAEL